MTRPGRGPEKIWVRLAEPNDQLPKVSDGPSVSTRWNANDKMNQIWGDRIISNITKLPCLVEIVRLSFKNLYSYLCSCCFHLCRRTVVCWQRDQSSVHTDTLREGTEFYCCSRMVIPKVLSGLVMDSTWHAKKLRKQGIQVGWLGMGLYKTVRKESLAMCFLKIQYSNLSKVYVNVAIKNGIVLFSHM